MNTAHTHKMKQHEVTFNLLACLTVTVMVEDHDDKQFADQAELKEWFEKNAFYEFSLKRKSLELKYGCKTRTTPDIEIVDYDCDFYDVEDVVVTEVEEK